MIQRLRTAVKTLYSCFFISLFLLQWFGFGDNSLSQVSQRLILNFFILLGIYGFHGTDLTTARSAGSSLISYLLGSSVGTACAALLFLTILPAPIRLAKIEFYTTFVISCLVFSMISRAVLQFVLRHGPAQKYLILQRDEKLFPILAEIEKASFGKLQFPIAFKNFEEFAQMPSQAMKHFQGVLITNQQMGKEFDTHFKGIFTSKLEVIYLSTLAEKWLRRIPIEVLISFEDYYRVSLSEVQETHPKRLFDVTLSIFAIIITLPIMLFTAFCIFIASGLPIVFTQRRLGIGGKIFTMLKFRSMQKNSDLQGNKYADSQKSQVTKIGKVIRPIRLDELPQFFNILRGTMAFIGPRPEQPTFGAQLREQIPYYSYRLNLKPGLTGWAQVNYRYASTLEEQIIKLSYDLFYIKNRSFTLDVRVCLHTIETIIFRKGAI